MNMLISTHLLKSTSTAKMILRVIVVVVVSRLADGMNYNGTCDDVQPFWLSGTELKLEKRPFDIKEVYTSFYQNDDCSGSWLLTNIQDIPGCGPSVGGSDMDDSDPICFRCINGTIQAYLQQAKATVDINCADGCGYTCYKLDDQVSIRVGWHSSHQPLCSNTSEVCAPPAPAPTTATSSSSSALFSFINIHMSRLFAGLVVGALFLQ